MIKFGPSGNSQSFYDLGLKHTEQSAVLVKNMGLNAFEYSFGRGVNMSEEKATSIGKAFKENGVEISAHAPYFINLANPDNEMATKSFTYIIDTAKAVRLMGGNRVVFHPASEGKMTRVDAVKLTIERLKILKEIIYEEGLSDIIFCPETMGKLRQIGTLEEVVEFCKVDKVFCPAIDFGHINAREVGSLNTKEAFKTRMQYMIDELGFERVKNFHVHFSKIQYTAKGEVRHLTFEDTEYGPDYEPFLTAVKELGLKPFIICESAGTQAEDALKMKDYYNKI